MSRSKLVPLATAAVVIMATVIFTFVYLNNTPKIDDEKYNGGNGPEDEGSANVTAKSGKSCGKSRQKQKGDQSGDEGKEEPRKGGGTAPNAPKRISKTEAAKRLAEEGAQGMEAPSSENISRAETKTTKLITATQTNAETNAEKDKSESIMETLTPQSKNYATGSGKIKSPAGEDVNATEKGGLPKVSSPKIQQTELTPKNEQAEAPIEPPTDTADYSLLKSYWSKQSSRHVFKAPTEMEAQISKPKKLTLLGSTSASGVISPNSASPVSSTAGKHAGTTSPLRSTNKTTATDAVSAAENLTTSFSYPSTVPSTPMQAEQMAQNVIPQSSLIVPTPDVTMQEEHKGHKHHLSIQSNPLDSNKKQKKEEEGERDLTAPDSVDDEHNSNISMVEAMTRTDSRLILKEGSDGSDGDENSGCDSADHKLVDDEEGYVKIIRTSSGDPMTESELFTRPATNISGSDQAKMPTLVAEVEMSNETNNQEDMISEETCQDVGGGHSDGQGGDPIPEAISSESETFSISDEELAVSRLVATTANQDTKDSLTDATTPMAM